MSLLAAACTPSSAPPAPHEPEATPRRAEPADEPEPDEAASSGQPGAAPDDRRQAERQPPPELLELAHCERSAPPELSVLEFRADAAWRRIVPLQTSEAEVRTILGEPKEVYPDDGTKPTLFIYDTEGPWDVYVYLVGGDYFMRKDYPPSLFTHVGSVDLLPEADGIQFKGVRVPKSFTRKEVMAADANWVDFRHATGLTYSVYGDEKSLGRLQRISHRPSDCQREALGLPTKPD